VNVISYLFTVIIAAASVGFTVWGFSAGPRRLSATKEKGDSCPPAAFHKPAPMTKRDFLPLAVICLVYGALAFIGLGDTKAPESYYVFSKGAKATVELSQAADIQKLFYFSGPDVGNYKLETSVDGKTWLTQADLEQGYNDILKWHTYDFEADYENIRYIRLSSLSSALHLGEIALYDRSGERLTFKTVNELTDEQELVPERASYLNSVYFDEIYHVRTAWENIVNKSPYEISHPPLGKLIISVGIRLFGLVPFGWRFMGVLFGILMLPILYVFIKNLFGSTLIAACGTTVFAFDFMHFVQTRIATIDTYGVFFILLMFYFMYRYFVLPYDTPVKKTLPWLLLSGLSFGLGAASKWTVIYGGVGLGLIWLIRQALCLRWDIAAAKQDNRKLSFGGYLTSTILWSLLFFVILPVFIYVLSYYPYGLAKNVKLFSPEYLKIVWDNQTYMFSYHSGLTATHPYESRWWKWVTDYRPILYYLDYFEDKVTKSAFGAFGNPLFWWTGLGAMISMLIKTIRGDKLAAFILIGYLTSLLPWVFITRCTFIYHYFPCTVFLALALCYLFSDMCRRTKKRYDRLVPIFTGLCLLMFIIFYPVLTGIRFSIGFTNAVLRWFGGNWPF
jgi:dolichyl-phosphate-mannose-protein mannosyltransferase